VSGMGPLPTTTALATDEQLSLWASGAVLFDDRELGAALLPDSEQRTVWRATALLEMGRPDEALSALQAEPTAPISAPSRWSDLVVLAARAQRGDLHALQVLAAVQLDGQLRVQHARLLALAASTNPDRAMADGAWTAYVGSAGTSDPEAMVNVCVGTVLRRNREDAQAMDDALASVIRVVAASWRNEPTMRVPLVDRICGDLAASGDVVGAALVVDVMTRFHAPSPGLDAVRERWDVPLLWGRNLAIRVVPYLVAAALAATGLILFDSMYTTVWLVPLLALTGWGTRLRMRFPVYPGHTKAESWLRSRYRTLGVDGARKPPITSRNAGHMFVGGTLGFVAGLFGAALLADPSGPLGDSAARWAISLYVVLLPGGTVLGAVVAEQVRRQVVLRSERIRLLKEAGASAAPVTCRCWELRGIVGEAAVHYANQHLTPLALALPPQAYAALAGVVNPQGLAVLGCPLTGTAWLALNRLPVPSGRPLRHQQVLVAAPPPMPPETALDGTDIGGGYL